MRKVWTARWETLFALQVRRDWATKDAKKLLRTTLKSLAHGKCVYCESRLATTSHIEIEHYIAKTVNPERAFDWNNLFPACRLCNGTKGGLDHHDALLKPDDEDPEPYFWVGPNGDLQPHPALDEAARQRALITINACGLQRDGLRAARLFLMRLVRGALHAPSAEILEELLAPECEYKLVVRRVLEEFGNHELAVEDRRRFQL